MRVATLLLMLVCIFFNVTYYSVLIQKNIYSLAWAPNVFLVSWLLLLTESKMKVKNQLIYAALVFFIVIPGSNLFFFYVFTQKFSGVDGYLINDVIFVSLNYWVLLFLKRHHLFLSEDIQSHTRYLINYFTLILAGIVVTFFSAVPAGLLFFGLSGEKMQQLLLGSLLSFFLYGIPVYFSWLNRFNFHFRLYQGQAILSIVMVLSVFILPGGGGNVFNWLLWGGVFLTLLWHSAWCQVIVFGLWGPLITQEFALRDNSLTDYGSLLFIIMLAQILWLSFLHGDLLYERLKKKIDKQNRMLNTDPLTSCLNRRGFFTVCQTLLREESSLCVGILDINHFKAINDNFGHEVGDKVLQIVANRLAGCMGGRARVSRLGGDEFAFLLPESEALVQQKCQFFFSQLSERPIVISSQLLYVGVSLGISFFPRDGRKPEHLLHYADIAMYRAKRQRLQESVMYDPSMNIIINNVFDAVFFSHVPANVILECHAFFQPVYNVKKKCLYCVEALIRHPEINTTELISWAEQSGRLDEMFERMLILSLPVIRELSLPISLNISPMQLLSPDKIIKLLSPVIEQRDLSFYVSLEITETVAIADSEQFSSALSQLRTHGFKISLDDFGAGFSFFETLNMGYFDIIKLDRGLIADIHLIAKKQYLVRSIIHYAEGLGITIIAEGVETKEEADYLLASGIIYMQGFYFSTPLSWDALCTTVKQEKLARDGFFE